MVVEAWAPPRSAASGGGDASARLEHVWRHSDGSTRATCRHEGRRRILEVHGFGVFELDLETGRIHGRAVADLPGAVVERRFWKEAVPILHQANGAVCLHASAVERPGGAVLLIGPSTAGKSSLARAWALRQGARQLADDTVVVYPTADGGFEVHPLPFVTHVRGVVRGRLERPDLEVDTPGLSCPVAALVFVEPREAGRPRLDGIAAQALPTMLAESCCFSLADEASRTSFYAAHLDLLCAVASHRLVYPHVVSAMDTAVDLLETLVTPGSTVDGP